MTGIDRPPYSRGGVPMGPPWPVDVLADLHAGALEPEVARQLWPRVRQDPEAVAVLDALDATRAELSGLAAARPVPMPAHFAARLDAAIATEAAGRPAMRVAPSPSPSPLPTAPVLDLARARRKRNQRLGWAAGVLVAAAAVAVAVISIPRGTTAGTPSAGGALALHSGEVNGATLAAAIGHDDYGPFADPARRKACLAANDVDPSVTPAGVLRVTLDGTPGVLFVLPTGRIAQYRLLVVGDGCDTGNASRLDSVIVGGIPATPTR